mmetsp:Transcript_8333/g.25112  ORF Transcript_8333/g.25112 Transcript_8333/m.25112 type:complete len:249 (-) Transcript_8333:1328-2074(-)
MWFVSPEDNMSANIFSPPAPTVLFAPEVVPPIITITSLNASTTLFSKFCPSIRKSVRRSPCERSSRYVTLYMANKCNRSRFWTMSDSDACSFCSMPMRLDEVLSFSWLMSLATSLFNTSSSHPTGLATSAKSMLVAPKSCTYCTVAFGSLHSFSSILVAWTAMLAKSFIPSWLRVPSMPSSVESSTNANSDLMTSGTASRGRSCFDLDSRPMHLTHARHTDGSPLRSFPMITSVDTSSSQSTRESMSG